MLNEPLILFDGICNLCNGSVQYVIKHDKNKIFKFASLQGEYGQGVLKQFHLPQNDLNSFILLDNNRVYTKSTAALLVAKKLTGVVKILYIFTIIPAFIRDGIYSFVARNRYKWFGKRDTCIIPHPSLKSRFLN